MQSNIGYQQVRSPLKFGCKQEGKNALCQVIDSLLCVCRGRVICSKSSMCSDQGLSCTEMCSCNASDECKNARTHAETDVDEAE